MSKVSVIIINYNGEGLTLGCLKALAGQTLKDFEVVIVDNGSIDNSPYEIQMFLKESPLASITKLIPLDRNFGFAGGNIQGLKHAHNSEYIALLNNDTEPENNWLKHLVSAMDSEPMVGICASKLIVYGTNIIDSAGDGFSTCLKGFKRGEGENAALYSKKEYVFGACAGAALYRRKMIDEIGFLDEDFFLIHEDTDLNLRAQLHGWKVLYVPEAIVFHKVRSSISNKSNTAVYYSLRNSEFVRIKNIPFPLFLRYLPIFLLGMVWEFLDHVKRRQMVLYFKAKLDAIKLLPAMLNKRKINMKARRLCSKDLRETMTPILKLKWDFLRNKFRKPIFEE
jgi:GT2 family glycosyltransferase